ncbi:MAG: hypothetical protein IPK12_22975, partial [Gemmatimonadetes bacterium]|nr:hypothetical protein [Gemmatimonadota bacterium]
RRQTARIEANPLFSQLLEAMPGPACLINAQRQIIAANGGCSSPSACPP